MHINYVYYIVCVYGEKKNRNVCYFIELMSFQNVILPGCKNLGRPRPLILMLINTKIFFVNCNSIQN